MGLVKNLKCICAPDGNVIRQLQDEMFFVVHSSDGLSHFALHYWKLLQDQRKGLLIGCTNWLLVGLA